MSNLSQTLAGRFIVIDGPDGAGKSTQIKLLTESLRQDGGDVCLVRDPGGTAIGDKIRLILLDKAHDEMAVQTELMLYMASRAQLTAQVIRPALLRRQCVLSDRWVSSTVAYQGAGGVNVAEVQTAANIAVGGLWPDLTIILDLSHDQGLDRVSNRTQAGLDRVEAKGLEYHRRVREIFLEQARQHPERFAIVDAVGTVEQVLQRLASLLQNWTFRT